uniref:Lipocalin/cytosolic fatty-acid binding domain-containing protein n=1 Tax=Pinguiococcus pyrenoidosus TaxID=172671 RepID=A0A7R9U4G6_9STRA|mmetsp:Transcript_14580/g.55082  ORF Transcript_14580/g.55082 Transcript_14580/m.55082 type:complete len:162 (+) Transcript_14580:500-985(+)
MGGSSGKPLQVVKGPIDVQKFMGEWFVIGVKPTSFEIGAHNAIERYTLNGNKVDVDFTFNQNSLDGKLKSLPQTLYPSAEDGNWKVSPFWPLKLSYPILELDEDYSYTVIGFPSRAYVWIMAREPKMDEQLYEDICARLREQHGYDLEGLVKVPHQAGSEE